MPLSPPVEREHLHTRAYAFRGYRRADGLWDIEGHMTDTKTYSFPNEWRGEIASGEPIHDMSIRLTVDDELTIVAVEAVTDRAPYAMCGDIAPAYGKLVGVSLKPGFTARCRELLGGVRGCTHLLELLGPVATTAHQTIHPMRERLRRQNGEPPPPPGRRPRLLNTCHAFAADSPVVARRWPEFHTGRGAAGPKTVE